MDLEPKPGLVIRFDYLWKEDHDAGREDGSKDRPCAIIIATPERSDGSKGVMLCAITHTPPAKGQGGIEIPIKVARYLGLDERRSWIKTHQINTLTWEAGRIPFGVTPVAKGKWSYGQLPDPLAKAAFAEVRARYMAKTLGNVPRDTET